MSGGSYFYVFRNLARASKVLDCGSDTCERRTLKRMCVDVARAPTWNEDLAPTLAVQASAILAEPLVASQLVRDVHVELAKAWEWAYSSDSTFREFADRAAHAILEHKSSAAYAMLLAWASSEQSAAKRFSDAMQWRESY